MIKTSKDGSVNPPTHFFEMIRIILVNYAQRLIEILTGELDLVTVGFFFFNPIKTFVWKSSARALIGQLLI